jgi:hypothetical protein
MIEEQDEHEGNVQITYFMSCMNDNVYFDSTDVAQGTACCKIDGREGC